LGQSFFLFSILVAYLHTTLPLSVLLLKRSAAIPPHKQIPQKVFTIVFAPAGFYHTVFFTNKPCAPHDFFFHLIKYFNGYNCRMAVPYIIPISLPNILAFLTDRKVLGKGLLQHHIAFIFLILNYLLNRFCIPSLFARYSFNPLEFQMSLYLSDDRPCKYKSNIFVTTTACSGTITIFPSIQSYPMKFLYFVKISPFSNLR